jgi:hypothetical protein
MPSDTDTQERRLPLAGRVADGAVLVLAAAALWIAFLGGNRYLIFGVVVSLRSPLLAVYAAASTLIVRHLLWPRPSILHRLIAARGSLHIRSDLAAALRAFVATRPAVLLVGFLAVVTFGTAAAGFELSKDPLANLPVRFDAGWYWDIALKGYSWDHSFQRQRNIAFFPALPMLMRPVGAVFGMYDPTVPVDRRMLRGLWAGVAISLVAFLWGLVYIVRLGRTLVGDEAAANAALLLAAYPFAVFFSAPYTESLYLLSAAGAFYHFCRGEWRASSAWGLLLGLTRPNGCFASVPLAILGAQQLFQSARVPESGFGTRDSGLEARETGLEARESGLATVASGFSRKDNSPLDLKAVGWRPIAVRLLTAAMPGIGMLLFTVYLHSFTGVWFAWARSHEAWGRSYQGLAPFVTAFGWLRDEPLVQVIAGVPYSALNTMGVLFALAMTYPVFRRLGLPWGVFVLINLIPPLFAGGVLSMGRLTSTLFPIFFALALLIRPRSLPAWTAGFAVAQGLCAALFFTWRQLF